MSAFTVAIVSLSLNQAAYFAEIIRGGLAKLRYTQIEAAEALALTTWQRFRLIVFPQVMYMVTPALMGQTTQLIKSTPVVSVIGLKELTGMGRAVVVSTHRPLLCFAWVAVFYFITCFALQIVAKQTEKINLRIMRGTGG
ncbi:MAG: ABC transporter permease subunit [Planctomycetota bacterium]|nr:ABC transporter permease subunit [Planctomycetota bacterium]